MKLRIPHLPPRVFGWFVAIVAAGAAFFTRGTWIPVVEVWVRNTIASQRSSATSPADPPVAKKKGHDHGHSESLKLSETALRNLGLTPEFIQPVQLTTFRRGITVPAMVAERPGRTRLLVAAPMTGVVMHVHAVEGEAVEPGTLLFQIRLTHEDLVQAQTGFLQTIGELDVERREIARLTESTATGAVAKIKLLEKQYARDKLEALLSAQREALRLHGLSETQVDQISRERRLIRELQVFAPEPDRHTDDELKPVAQQGPPVTAPADPEAGKNKTTATPLVISRLHVHKGQSVAAGESLCVLSDYSDLYIEGLAFEQDAGLITATANRKWPVSAVIQLSGNQTGTLDGLQIARLSNEVDPESRTMRLYVRLPNEVERLTASVDGNLFVGWRYRPGQRLQLRVPVEEWPNEIVLPVEAVTKEGAEFYVFQQNGSRFDRTAVHVRYRDQDSVVIANDGALFPGDVVALRGAHQMQMALKTKAGGGADLHAGHTHN